MSQEQPPIRSRRELRKAREAQQAAPASTEQRPPAAGRPADRPSGPAPRPQSPADQPATQRSSQIRARDRATLRAIKELEEKEGQLSAGGPPTRRQLRLQQLKEQALTAANPVVPPAAAPRPPEASDAEKGSRSEAPAAAPGSAPEGMTVEQALEARALIAAQARNQIAKMEHIASTDPEAVDPDILAEQIALAERAAVLNRRAMARQKLAEQAGTPANQARPADKRTPGIADKPGPSAADKPGPAAPADKPGSSAAENSGPSTASNLAMVTPLEFVQVPGVERPVMKPPATSHVPVTTRPGKKVSPGAKGAQGKRKPAARPKAPATDSVTGRSQVIARAEAAAKAAGRPKPVPHQQNQPEIHPGNQPEDLFEDLRVPARSAYGLEPLDAATAGLARAQRNRILQFCILAFGILALVAGIILIVSGMSR